ncbi:phosphorylase family protein [Streptomyces antibioticus]|uniref:phosphorylase family protein n=1 Tax=Streptomyces antibioticus TaxID=1890 RepID=UPI0036D9C41C
MPADATFTHRSPDRPTFAWCRAAARAVRAAECGGAAVASVRGRSVNGLVRARGPLSVMLYAAARENRLVRQGERGFMLLEPPLLASRRVFGPGVGDRLLRLVDRRWDALLFAVPVLVGFGAVGCLLPFPAGRLTALFLTLAVLVHVAVWTTAVAVTGALSLWRSFGRRGAGPRAVAESLAADHWTVALCHLEDVRRTDELLRRATGRLHVLIRTHAESAAAALGYEVRRGEAAETLVLLRRGVTTDAVRQHLDTRDESGRAADVPKEVPVEVLVFHPAGRSPDPAGSRIVNGSFLLWYLGAMAVVVLVGASFVAAWERDACAGSCPGRPTGYREAVRWLAQRLFLSDPAGLAPATGAAQLFGWLCGLMAVLLLPVAFVAVRQQHRANTAAREPHRRLERRTMPTKLLLLVVTQDERDAVFEAVSSVNGTPPTPRYLGDRTVFDLGRISDVDLHVVQSEQASGGPAGSALVSASMLEHIRPDFFVMVGICCGLRPGKQRLGDVVVSSQLRMMDHQRVGDADGKPVITLRGDKVSASGLLLDRLRVAQVGWKGAAVHFGLMLSSSVLIDFAPHRDALVELEPDAVAAEMEGGGMYAAAARDRVPWIVVKAVSDWGAGKTDDVQAAAARNAADLVVRMVSEGALDPHTWQSRHTS